MRRLTLGGLARLAVAVGLTAYMLWKSDPARVLQAAAGADLWWIGLAAALVIADRTLMAYRWLVLLRPVTGGSLPPFAVVMRIFFVSTFLGTFLPASVGGDAVRAYSLARQNVAGTAAVASVFMDRMLGVLSILMLAVVGLLFARDLAAHRMVIAGLALTTGACAVTALMVFSQRAAAWGSALLERVRIAPVRRIGTRLIEAMQRYATSHRALLNVVAGSLGVQILRIVQGYCLGRSLGIGVPLVLYFAFIPLILLVMLLPISVNGLGVGQWAFDALFVPSGVARSSAFTLSVLFVALGIIGNLPGALLYLSKGVPSAATSHAATGTPRR